MNIGRRGARAARWRTRKCARPLALVIASGLVAGALGTGSAAAESSRDGSLDDAQAVSATRGAAMQVRVSSPLTGVDELDPEDYVVEAELDCERGEPILLHALENNGPDVVYYNGRLEVDELWYFAVYTWGGVHPGVTENLILRGAPDDDLVPAGVYVTEIMPEDDDGPVSGAGFSVESPFNGIECEGSPPEDLEVRCENGVPVVFVLGSDAFGDVTGNGLNEFLGASYWPRVREPFVYEEWWPSPLDLYHEISVVHLGTISRPNCDSSDWGGCIFGPLRRGDTGPEVRCLEERLVELGFPIVVNGHFGERVADAVRQIKVGAGLAANAVAGPRALDVIFDPALPAVTSWGECITRGLRHDDSGYQVRCLERRLVELGFPIVVNGHFGPRVVDAVRQLKMGAGLAANGVAGPLALDVIFDPDLPPVASWGECVTRTLRPGDTGYQVRCLERRLRAMGFNVVVNGHYGPRVTATVRDIKRYVGLAANGVANPRALDVIFD